MRIRNRLAALLAVLAFLCLWIPHASATGAERIVYGTSVRGRDLVCWRIGEENAEKSVLLVFAVHGFEDEYAGDGVLLKRIAEETIAVYEQEPERLQGFTLYVIPCANPDGLEDGTTNWGFGRCNADGYDINRDFSIGFEPGTADAGTRTGPEPFTTPEARAIRDLAERIRPTYAADVHGYIQKIYYESSPEMAETFAAPFGFSTGRWGTSGMMCQWLDSMTEGTVLIELRTPLRTQARFGGSANELWLPLNEYVKDQGDKLREGLETWLHICAEQKEEERGGDGQ